MKPFPFVQCLRRDAIIAVCYGFSASLMQAAIVAHIDAAIAIPFSHSGVYLDVETGNAGTSDSLAGWDLNFFFGGEAIGANTSLQPVKAEATTLAPIVNLAPGTIVGASTPYYVSGTTGSSTHIGSGSNQFANGLSGYLGFQFTESSSNALRYGWIEVTLANDGTTGTIHSWAWDNTGAAIPVGLTTAIPEPRLAALLLGLAAWGLIIRRRRDCYLR